MRLTRTIELRIARLMSFSGAEASARTYPQCQAAGRGQVYRMIGGCHWHPFRTIQQPSRQRIAAAGGATVVGAASHRRCSALACERPR